MSLPAGPSFDRRLWLTVLLAPLLCLGEAQAQLQWGTGGAGGGGAWDLTTPNWWNGTDNVVWSGGTAVFGGSGAIVNSVFAGVTASGLTFNGPGYSLQDGRINAAPGDFVVTANEAASIDFTLSGSNSTLVKRGVAPLTVTGINSIHDVRIEQGEYRTDYLFSSNTVLANTPGVVLTLFSDFFSSANIGSLSGGGALGGIVQPDDQAQTLEVSVGGTGTFDGVMQDNGAGKLAVKLLGSYLNLTRANTYSGTTTASVGTLILSGNGTAIASAGVAVAGNGILRLDNSGTALSQRLADTADLGLQSGRVELIGNASTAVDEHLGILKYAGAVSLNALQTGSTPAWLTFAGAQRTAHATIDVTGTGRIGWTGLVNDAAGLAGPAITFGNEWATVGADGRLEPFTAYVSNLATSTGTDHVKLTANATLAASAAAATLNLQNNTGSAGLLDIGAGNLLSLADGGVLTSGNAGNEIRGGTLRIGASELVITNRTDLKVSSNITEDSTPISLTKTGAGTLTLTGTNSYSGTTAINQGVLGVGSDAALGTGSTVEFNGGTLLATASFSSPKGLTRGSNLAGTIDTAGFDVAFNGSIGTGFIKTGAGTLTLADSTIGSITVSSGTLALPNSQSNTVTLGAGTLMAAGQLTSLSITKNGTLDLGGEAVATLRTNAVSLQNTIKLTIRMGIGPNAAGSDLWSVGSITGTPVGGLGTGSLVFDFQNIGGVATGVAYPLITLDFAQSSLPLNALAFSPAATAAGWQGTFSVAGKNVNVTFTSAPEPGAVPLVLLGLFGLTARRRCGRKSENDR